MDAERFDTIARSLTQRGSRRRAVASAVVGALGLAVAVSSVDEVDARKKPCPPCKRRKNGKCKKTLPDGAACSGGTCRNGSCVAPATRPAPPPCANGMTDGNETDTDCGGSCPRCANTKRCASRDDCASAVCVDSICTECTTSQCGPDQSGQQCFCDQPANGGPKVCDAMFSTGLPVDDCDNCRPGTTCVNNGPDLFLCYKLCGAP